MLTFCRYYIIICAIVVLEIIMVYFTYPETKSITLEEISIVFDGERAAQNTGVKATAEDEPARHIEDKNSAITSRREVPE